MSRCTQFLKFNKTASTIPHPFAPQALQKSVPFFPKLEKNKAPPLSKRN